MKIGFHESLSACFRIMEINEDLSAAMKLSQLLTDSASKNISEPEYNPDVNSSYMSSEDYSTILNLECGTTTMISVDGHAQYSSYKTESSDFLLCGPPNTSCADKSDSFPSEGVPPVCQQRDSVPANEQHVQISHGSSFTTVNSDFLLSGPHNTSCAEEPGIFSSEVTPGHEQSINEQYEELTFGSSYKSIISDFLLEWLPKCTSSCEDLRSLSSDVLPVNQHIDTVSTSGQDEKLSHDISYSGKQSTFSNDTPGYQPSDTLTVSGSDNQYQTINKCEPPETNIVECNASPLEYLQPPVYQQLDAACSTVPAQTVVSANLINVLPEITYWNWDQAATLQAVPTGLFRAVHLYQQPEQEQADAQKKNHHHTGKLILHTNLLKCNI